MRPIRDFRPQQPWALDFRGFFGGFDLEFDARYAGYLNRRYQKEVLAPLTLYGRRTRKMFPPYRRAGPVNWTPRFDAMCLIGGGFKMFLRYL